MMKQKNIYFAWIKFQRRAISMESTFEYKTNHVISILKNKYLRIFDYLIKTAKTLIYLFKHEPQVVWLQLPPTFILNLLLYYKKLFNPKVVIISDCHNGVFSGKWKEYFNPKTLNKSSIIIVHNNVIRDIAVEMGADPDKIFILEDRPADKRVIKERNEIFHNQILMPCGFSKDEPLEVVFEAAKYIPNVTILISGPKERGRKLFDYSKKPNNVKLIGYLSLEDYEKTFTQSAAILALTTEDHIQLSVANEAVGMEKAMVLSNTPLLRSMFHKGVVHVDTLDAKSMASGIKSALKKVDSLEEEMKELKIERNIKWDKMALDLKEIINQKRK